MYAITVHQCYRQTEKQTDGRTDGRHSHGNTALRTDVLRAVTK